VTGALLEGRRPLVAAAAAGAAAFERLPLAAGLFALDGDAAGDWLARLFARLPPRVFRKGSLAPFPPAARPRPLALVVTMMAKTRQIHACSAD
jgi:hypothetical protein